MPTSQNLLALGAAELSRRIRARSLTPSAILSECLDRIDARESVVEAWQYLNPAARLQAQALDPVAPQTPLHGIPIGIKDIIDTADMPTGLGSPIFADRRPSEDAAVVRRLRAAGAVMVGKTVTTEFAYFTPGKTRNPHDPRRTPGGSSSGSAAAVADGMVPVAIATQAAGSTIRPASFCGIWAFKPSFDRWTLRGSLQLYPTLDTLSVYARNVEDLILVDSVVAEAGQQPLPAIRRPRIGLFTPPASHSAQTDPTWRLAVEAAARHFAAAGAEIVPAPVPEGYEAALAASITILSYEARHAMRFVPEAEYGRISPRMREMLESGSRISDAAYDAAVRLGRQAREASDAMLREFDAVLSPGATGEAPVGLDSTGDPVFIRVWNFLHAASANIPLCVGPGGMPVGVQMVAARGCDEQLLAVLAWAERTINRPARL